MMHCSSSNSRLLWFYITVRLVALWLATKSRATFSTNPKENQFQQSISELHLAFFSNRGKSKTIRMDVSFICMWKKTHIHMNGFALGHGLKRRLRATRKWVIVTCSHTFFPRLVPVTYMLRVLISSLDTSVVIGQSGYLVLVLRNSKTSSICIITFSVARCTNN